MDPEVFRRDLSALTAQLQQRPLDSSLRDWLNTNHAPGTTTFDALREACESGVQEGWLCQREGSGIKYGRIFKPAEDLHGFSVDVVDMNSIAGPHHLHPNGEIDLVMPIDDDARFDGQGAGWVVYGPGSSHAPTVTGGRALVLYLLPQGAIEFTKA